MQKDSREKKVERMSFESLKLEEPVLKAINESGFNTPTSLQVKVIPKALKRENLLIVAPPRTGKTDAFTLPIIQLIHKIDGQSKDTPVIRAVIICPDKKQVQKVDKSVRSYSKYTAVKHAFLAGGAEQKEQVDLIKDGVHILIGTPRRIIKLIQGGIISTSEVKITIFSETHRMMKRDFINELEELVSLLPEKKHSMLFTTKISNAISKISAKLLGKFETIEIDASESAPGGPSKKDLKIKKKKKKKEPKRGIEALPAGLRKKFRWPLG